MGRYIRHGVVSTEDKFNKLIERYDDMTEIKDARIYWNDKDNTIILVASQWWRDYLTGKSDVRPEN
jgi:hypothetical protein